MCSKRLMWARFLRVNYVAVALKIKISAHKLGREKV
jgi:hypothetical protein